MEPFIVYSMSSPCHLRHVAAVATSHGGVRAGASASTTLQINVQPPMLRPGTILPHDAYQAALVLLLMVLIPQLHMSGIKQLLAQRS